MAALIRCAAIALVFASATARAQDRGELAFGYSLLQDGDGYRAITEFKRFAFFNPAAPDAFAARLAIARAYELGNKASDGAQWLSQLEGTAPDAQARAQLRVELGYARLLAGDEIAAIDELHAALDTPDLTRALPGASRARARYLLGWALLFNGESEKAATQFADVPLADSTALADAARGYENLPHKSPLLAGALSALVPGLGHLYLGMPGIALAALAWNALFVFASYDALHHKLWGVGSVLVGLELLWYGGAVFGAVSGAEKYNRDAQLNYLDDLKSRWDVAPQSWPPDAVRPASEAAAAQR